MKENDINLLENYYSPKHDTEAKNRADIIYDTIKNNIKLIDEQKIIDIWFWWWFLLQNFLQNNNKDNLFWLDISNKYIEWIDFLNKDNLFVWDATDESVFDDIWNFDITISTDVIEHVFNPISLVENMIKVTNIWGYIVLNIPLEISLKARLWFLLWNWIHDPFNIWWHIRFFKPIDLISFFNKYDSLEIIKIDYDMWFWIDSFKRKIKKKLAELNPNLFAWRVVYICKRVK